MAFNSSMPMFWGDYLRDTGHLSPAEHGAYLMLIAHQWTTAKPLPDDDIKLARIARMTAREWRSAKAVLIEFFDVEDETWSQGRVASELVKARDLYELRSQGGQRSAERRRKSKDTTQQSPNTLATVNHAVHHVPKPEPEPEPITTSKLSLVDKDPVGRETFKQTAWRLSQCGQSPRPFHAGICDQWEADGATIEDLSVIPEVLTRERNRRIEPGLFLPLDYFTNPVMTAMRERTTRDAGNSEIEQALAKVREKHAAE